MKRSLAFLVLLCAPIALWGQAGTPVNIGPWSILNEQTDISGEIPGCYVPGAVHFAPNAATITMTSGSVQCGNSNHTTVTNNYSSGAFILHDLNFKPTVGHNLVLVSRIQMGRGWPAFWLLGGNKAANTGCQLSTLTSWDNIGTCNWDLDSSDSAEIDIMESNEIDGYNTTGGNIFNNGGHTCGGVNIGANGTAGFHNYRVVWTTASVTWSEDSNTGGNCSGAAVPQNPMFILLENREINGGAPPLPQTMTVQWVQVCDAGSGTTCTSEGSNTGNTIFFDNFNYPPPAIFYTDLDGGPNSGGEVNGAFAGAYVTLYGNNFGSAQGSSTVTWNGLNCLRVVPATGGYTGWGQSYLGYQKIIVQLGASCTPGTGNFVVTTPTGASTSPSITYNGTSHTGSQFIVRSGNIRCVSTGGNDSNAGTFAGGCWATLVKAGSTMASGDVTYLENGFSKTSVDGFLAAFSIVYGPFNPNVGLIAYPGATATIGANGGGTQYALRNPAIAGTFTGWTIAGLNLRSDTCTQFQALNYRIIANDMTCSGATGFAANLLTNVSNYAVYGNNIHNIGQSCTSNGNSCKLFHAVYFGDASNHIDFGWNIVDPDPANTGVAGCRGVQWHVTDTSAGQNEFDIHVHDNIIRNSICDGLNLVTVNPDLGAVEVFNNVFYHNGKGPAPSGQESGYAGIATGAQGGVVPVTPVLIYNNSFYDNGARGTSDASNGNFYIQEATKLTNNVTYSANSGAEPYFAPGSGSCSLLSGSSNDWFGAGASPCGTQLTSSLNVDPKYTSITSGAATNNLALQSTSPVIGVGGTSLTSVYDINGLIRPSPPSMGAYELSAGTQVLTPTVQLAPTSLSYGSQTLSTTSAAQNVTLTNSGSATLTIASISLSGTNPGDFAISSNTCGTSLAPNGNCIVGVTFTPVSLGSRAANLTFSTNAATSPDNVPLTGTGVSAGAPAANFNPTSIAFGAIKLPLSSAPVAVTFKNAGTATMNISAIGLTGANASEFSQNNNCAATLAANATCIINVTFTPASRGSKAANLSVTSNTATSPDAIPLTGTGIAPIVALAPSTINFFNQLVGTTTSIAQVVLVSNTGDAPLTISTITMAGTNAADFGQSNNCGVSISVGSSCNITFTFTPSAISARSATLSIADDAASSPQVITLVGNGAKIFSGVGSISGTGTIKVN